MIVESETDGLDDANCKTRCIFQECPYYWEGSMDSTVGTVLIKWIGAAWCFWVVWWICYSRASCQCHDVWSLFGFSQWRGPCTCRFWTTTTLRCSMDHKPCGRSNPVEENAQKFNSLIACFLPDEWSTSLIQAGGFFGSFMAVWGPLVLFILSEMAYGSCHLIGGKKRRF